MSSERRRARRAALQALFEANQTGHDPEEALSRWSLEDELPDAAVEFARELIHGVREKREAIDDLIASTARAWPIGQLAVTDRIALEIGVYELHFRRRAPVGVAINEAVELAKVFGGANSAGFVNGVLRSIAEREATHSHAH